MGKISTYRPRYSSPHLHDTLGALPLSRAKALHKQLAMSMTDEQVLMLRTWLTGRVQIDSLLERRLNTLLAWLAVSDDLACEAPSAASIASS